MSTEPTSTTTNLFYHVPPEDGARAYVHINVNPKTGEREQNYGREERQAIIENLRGKEDTVSLDTTGFQYFKRPTKHTSFANDEEITREYYPESIELIKKLTGASKVVIFDHSMSFPYKVMRLVLTLTFA